MENTSACVSAGVPAGIDRKISSSSLSDSNGTSEKYAFTSPRPFRSSPQSSSPASTFLGILRGLIPAAFSALSFSFCLMRDSVGNAVSDSGIVVSALPRSIEGGGRRSSSSIIVTRLWRGLASRPCPSSIVLGPPSTVECSYESLLWVMELCNCIR